MGDSPVTRLRGMHRPYWRRMTWVLIVWNAIAFAYTIGSIAANPGVHCVQGQLHQLCRNAADTGTAIGIGILIALWIAGDIVFGIIWLATNHRRNCPVCGRHVRPGLTVCGSCGHDFRAAQL